MIAPGMPTIDDLDREILRVIPSLEIEPGRVRNFHGFEDLASFMNEELGIWNPDPIMSAYLDPLRQASMALNRARNDDNFGPLIRSAKESLSAMAARSGFPSSARGMMLYRLSKSSKDSVDAALAYFQGPILGHLWANARFVNGILAAATFSEPTILEGSLAATVATYQSEGERLTREIEAGKSKFSQLQGAATEFEASTEKSIAEAVAADRKGFQGEHEAGLRELAAIREEFRAEL